MSSSPASRFDAIAYAALRIFSGALFSMHGMQKLLGFFGATTRPPFPTQIWFGGVIELTAGALIAIGLFTRCAAFLASGTMAVAYTQFHWKLALAKLAWLPIVNKGELAVIYAFVFLAICARGGGLGSLDAWIAKRRG